MKALVALFLCSLLQSILSIPAPDEDENSVRLVRSILFPPHMLPHYLRASEPSPEDNNAPIPKEPVVDYRPYEYTGAAVSGNPEASEGSYFGYGGGFHNPVYLNPGYVNPKY